MLGCYGNRYIGAVRVGMIGKELIVNPSRVEVSIFTTHISDITCCCQLCRKLNVIIVASNDRLG